MRSSSLNFGRVAALFTDQIPRSRPHTIANPPKALAAFCLALMWPCYVSFRA